MTVLITGCNGFLGRLLVFFYTQEIGERCYGIGRSSIKSIPSFLCGRYSQVTLPSSTATQIIAELKPNLLIHAAGSSSVPSSVVCPIDDYRAGPPVVADLLDSIRLYSPQTKFIFLSSAAIYGNPPLLPIPEDCPPNPVSPYGYNKLQSELIVAQYAKIYGINAASVRIFSAYGPGLRKQFLWDFCKKTASGAGRIELYGTGNETRDYIYGMDVCRAINCIEQNAELQGQQINVCSGESIAISRLAHMLAAALSVNVEINFSGTELKGSPLLWEGNNSLLKSMGFTLSTSLSEGVHHYAKWFLSSL